MGWSPPKNGVLIPVQCEYLALEGLGQLTQTLNRVRSSLYPDLKVRGVILTMYDGRTKLATDVVSEVRKFFPDQVFEAIIPRSIRLAEAPSFGMPVTAYAPEVPAAKAYSALTPRDFITRRHSSSRSCSIKGGCAWQEKAD